VLASLSRLSQNSQWRNQRGPQRASPEMILKFDPYHIILYHTVDLKWQNRLKVGTDKRELKEKMQSVT